MRKLVLTIGLLVTLGAVAQTTSSSKETSRTTTSGKGISAETSVTRSSGTYKFEAKFKKEKYEAVKELIIDRLESSNLEVNGNSYRWGKKNSEMEYFICELSGRELYLSLDREVASDDFYELIDELGDELRILIQNHTSLTWTPSTPQSPSNPNSTDPQLVMNELRQAELELERARRNVERLKKKQD